jgi:V/A-type H+-transporting ATPase subunit E
MGVERVTGKIATDAEGRAHELAARAERRREEILAEAREEARRVEDETTRLGNAAEREESERLVALATLENRKALLEKKRSLIEQAFEEAVDHLALQEKNVYQEMIRAILLRVAETGQEEMMISRDDRSRLDQTFINDVNAALAGNGKKARITLSGETVPIRGGFLLRSGRRETDCSLDALLDTVREDLEVEISQFLFEEQR